MRISSESFRVFYYCFLLALGITRLLELKRAKRNLRLLLQNGGQEFSPEHYPWMVAFHATWFLACILEASLRIQPPSLPIFLLAFALFLIGFSLRLSAIWNLKERWTTRIVVLPQAPLITKGPYRYLRHPNYCGVVLEIFSVPLLAGAWVTAVLFSLRHIPLLALRIQKEEKAWREWGEVKGIHEG